MQPKYTLLPYSTAANLPYLTYYFRTQFVLTNRNTGYSLLFSNWVDDGAVFYLNGHEIQRLRLPAAPTQILNATPATSTPLGGDATNAAIFRLWGNPMTNILVGTNLLAVEVHNVASTDPDVTFGNTLGLVRALASETTLHVTRSNQIARLFWDGSSPTLQQASSLRQTNVWTDLPGPSTISPYLLTNPPAPTFFRLRD